MDVTEFLRQLQPYFAPIGIAAMGVLAVWLRSVSKRIDQGTEKAQLAIEKSDIEVEKAKLDVEREKFYLESTRDMYGRVKKLEEKDEANEKRIGELLERDVEHEDVLTVLRNQRETQDKELIRLNKKIEDLQGEITKLQNENVRLKQEVKDEQDARKRAEYARDTAEQANELKRQEWERDVTALREELKDMQSRIGTAETLITQTQENKGVTP